MGFDIVVRRVHWPQDSAWPVTRNRVCLFSISRPSSRKPSFLCYSEQPTWENSVRNVLFKPNQDRFVVHGVSIFCTHCFKTLREMCEHSQLAAVMFSLVILQGRSTRREGLSPSLEAPSRF